MFTRDSMLLFSGTHALIFGRQSGVQILDGTVSAVPGYDLNF